MSETTDNTEQKELVGYVSRITVVMESFEARDVVSEARKALNEVRVKAKYEVDAKREEFKFAVEFGAPEKVAKLKNELRTLLRKASAVTDAPEPTCPLVGLASFSGGGGAGNVEPGVMEIASPARVAVR